jgi:histidine triad (HIT) family protein
LCRYPADVTVGAYAAQVDGCVFCRIVAGDSPAWRVVESPAGVAFLDTRPVFRGHVLVSPRPHVVTLTDLPPTALPDYFALVQRVAAAVEVGLGAGGTFVAINNRVSQSVPHLHTHVVPRTKGDGPLRRRRRGPAVRRTHHDRPAVGQRRVTPARSLAHGCRLIARGPLAG